MPYPVNFSSELDVLYIATWKTCYALHSEQYICQASGNEKPIFPGQELTNDRFTYSVSAAYVCVYWVVHPAHLSVDVKRCSCRLRRIEFGDIKR